MINRWWLLFISTKKNKKWWVLMDGCALGQYSLYWWVKTFIFCLNFHPKNFQFVTIGKVLQFSDAKCLSSLLVQIAYGRFSPATKGYRDLDLFIQQKDGKKIQDPEKQSALCLSLKVEMLHPLRVIIANRGPDTKLLVANPVELSGKGRPLVFYDVTLALKALRICIFSVRIGSIKLKVIQKPTKIILE